MEENEKRFFFSMGEIAFMEDISVGYACGWPEGSEVYERVLQGYVHARDAFMLENSVPNVVERKLTPRAADFCPTCADEKYIRVSPTILAHCPNCNPVGHSR